MANNGNGMAGRRVRTETANSNTSLGSSLSFFVDTSPQHQQNHQLPANQTGNYKYSFDFSPVEQTIIDEDADDDFESNDCLRHKLPSVVSNSFFLFNLNSNLIEKFAAKSSEIITLRIEPS